MAEIFIGSSDCSYALILNILEKSPDYGLIEENIVTICRALQISQKTINLLSKRMGVKHEGISTRTGLEIILKEWKNTRKHQPTIKQLIYHFDRHKFRDFARLLRQTFLPGVNKEGEQSTKIIRQNPADFLKTMKLAIIESCVCTQTLLDALKDIINEDDKQKIEQTTNRMKANTLLMNCLCEKLEASEDKPGDFREIVKAFKDGSQGVPHYYLKTYYARAD